MTQSQETAGHAVGNDAWWQAVAKTNKAKTVTIWARSEREDLTDFRHHASLQLRHDIAVAFATFEAKHHGGIKAEDKDPKAVRRGER